MLAQMFTELVEADPAFRRDVLSGLSAPSRAIPARWFYDRADAGTSLCRVHATQRTFVS
jgi:hypothetical protein